MKVIFILMCLQYGGLTEKPPYWMNVARTDIFKAENVRKVDGTAKNVILFVGDGMGLTTVTAARIYGKSEAGYLSFEQLPNMGLLKTYNADKLVPDSSSTATALFSGAKINYKTSGVDSTVPLDDCLGSLNEETHLDGLMKWAQDAQKGTGFVTTTRVTHATPSALYAHTPNRNWECETKMPVGAKRCKDIARQLIENEPGKSINVIMGGGRQCLQSNSSGTTQDPVDTWACYSTDGRDLIKTWAMDKTSRKKKFQLCSTLKELNEVASDTKFLLGIFANGHMPMDHKRNGAPSLVNMTRKAIENLARNHENGYVLVIEGGLIDYAHHRGHARMALDETIAFSDAVQVALDMTSEEDTLVIVTSDHSHSLVFTGYPSRQSSILDIAQKAADGNFYTSLLYGTGGPNNYQYTVLDGKVQRRDPSQDQTTDFGYSQQAAVLTDEVTHGGTDVVVYARGPMAHLFHSVHEQTYVAYVISYAAKIGPLQDLKKAGADVIVKKPISLLLFMSTILNVMYFR